MTRKLIALIATTLLLFGLLPAAAAFASAAGTATITTARTTFPVDNTTVGIRVNNTEPAIVGKTVNYVDIILPAGTAGVVLDERTITPPSGWTVKKDVVGTFQAVTFKNATTGIAPGNNLVFNIPADITRPANSDRQGTFNVAISSNGGANTRPATAAPAGSLGIAVKILEVLGGSLGATTPPGVADQSGTGGQGGIAYGYSLRNYAQQAVSVSSTLASSNLTDTILPATKVTTVPGDPTASTVLSHGVTLGAVRPATADRTATMTVTATSTAAAADPKTRPLVAQVEPDITFANLDPTRVRSGLGANYTFRVSATKAGTPSVAVSSGSLRFAQTTANLPAPVNFTTNTAQQLQFEQVEVAGASGTYPPTVTMAGKDANDKVFDLTKPVGINIIIDNLAPVITITGVGIPENQIAVKDGDPITVDGCITNAVEDIRLNSLRVVLDPNVGNDVVITASTQAGAAGSGCDYTFHGSASPDWADGATSFKAVAEVADIAGNIGGDDTDAFLIDLILPTLLDNGRTESAREIRVQFADELTSNIAGGCDPNAWRIDNKPGMVQEVRYASTNGDCLGQAPDGSGVRILYLREIASMDQDDTPDVTYDDNPLVNNDPAQDGARNETVLTTIQTTTGIKPPAPSIVNITRNNGAETAHSEADANDSVTNYFTRFRGTGDVATEDLQVTFGGARNNYLIQVVNGQGQILNSQPLSNAGAIGTNREFNSSVRVPVGTADGTYRRGIRLVGNSNEGDISWFDVVVDTLVPSIANQALQSDGSTVVVNLNEPLVAGSDFANDWLAQEVTGDGDSFYRAMDVISTDSDTRTISFPLQNASAFRRVHYRLTSDNGIRYEDRAGNLMADTLTS